VKQIIVAADDQRIVDALGPYGTDVVMTRVDHPSGTDRIAEVARTIDAELIVNVQGDEPEIEPEIIDRLIERMSRSAGSGQATTEPMGTACTAFKSVRDVLDPNLVKVVVSQSGRAIYFSRSAIPFDRDGACLEASAWKLHLGLYAYRREFLLEFASWKPTPLERLEKLEQLRALEHDIPIGVIVADRSSHGIDTVEQYNQFVDRVGRQVTPEVDSKEGRSHAAQ